MTDDEVLRQTIVESLGINGLDSYAVDVDKGSLKTYHKDGKPRFQFKCEGITISGPMSAIVRERTRPPITRQDLAELRGNYLPFINGRVTEKRRQELFEEFYVDNPRQGKRTKDNAE